MTSTTKPVSYDSLKILLQYLEPNLRFRLCIQCPSIRKTERCVPLKLDDLELGNMRIRVNKTTYRLSIYRKYPEGLKPLNSDQDNNDSEQVRGDIDPFGFYDFSTFDLMTDGDVDARPDYYEDWRRQEDPFLTEEDLVESLTRYEKKMVSFEEKLKEAHASTSEIENIQRSMAWTQKQILEYKGQLEAYQRRRDNILPPYTNYIQLSIDKKPVEWVEYKNKKLHEALKYLTCLMFGGRRHILKVNQFYLWDPCYILRLPLDFKIRMKQITTQTIDFGKLDGMIDPSNYIEAIVCIEDTHMIYEQFNQPNIRNARKLIINLEVHDVDIKSIVERLENQWVVVEHYGDVESHAQLIRNWMRNGRREGTLFSFDLRFNKDAEQILKEVKSKFRSKILRDQGRSVTLKMPNGRTQIRVYYERNLTPQDRWKKHNWIHFQVERI